MIDKDRKRHRANTVHFDDGKTYGGLCGTRHGKTFHSSKLPEMVTCRRCLVLLGMIHVPQKERAVKHAVQTILGKDYAQGW